MRVRVCGSTGARGTSGAKLMLISSTSVAVCQIMTAFLLWRVEQLTAASGVSFVRCVLMWLAAAALILLGLAESAIDWKEGDKRLKDPPMAVKANGQGPPGRAQMEKEDDELFSSPMLPPSLARIMSVATDEDEAGGKACLRLLHMLAAFTVVGLNVASQWVGDDAFAARPVSAIFAAVGGITFFVFCIMVSHSRHGQQPPALTSHLSASAHVYLSACVLCCAVCCGSNG